MKQSKFAPDEIFFNTIEANPKVTFTFADGETYLNNISSSNTNVTNGMLSAYDLSVNRTGDERIYQFLNKDSDFASWATTSVSAYASALPGDQFKNYLALTSSVDVEFGTDLTHTVALKNTIDYYGSMSKYFDYNTYIDGQEIRLISIPSVFYGSSIQKGQIRLDFYYTGSLVSVVTDKNKDGELIQVSGSTTGNVVGIALYNEGFFILFGTGALGDDVTDGYTSGYDTGSWIDFADTGAGVVKSSFEMVFKGTTYTPTLTMFAHASPGKYNYSNNPTFILTGTTPNTITGSSLLYVGTPATIKNITTSSFNNFDAPFKKTTFISKVAIYDENQKLLGVANLAEPIKKTEDAGYTFKIRLDL
jgi:hypothetical protein